MKRVLMLSAQLLLALVPAAAQGGGRAAEKCEEPVYRLRDVSRRPVITEKPDPGITEEAISMGLNGIVRLSVVLCHTGRVTDINVLHGPPYGANELAVKAARGIKFKPAEKDGRPVSMYVKLEYVFNVAGGRWYGPPEYKPHNGRVEEVIIEGNRRLTDEEIARHIKTRHGKDYDLKEVERDLQTLLDLAVFDRAQTRVSLDKGPRGGVIVIFHVVELPIIRDLSFVGLGGVAEADVMKAWQEAGVRFCKECPYDASKAAAASEVIRKMLVARGRTDATVDVRVEELSSLSVALSFIAVGPQ